MSELSEQFGRDGAVVLRNVLTAAEVETLRAGIDANLAHPSPRAMTASRTDDPGYFIEDFCNWQENPHYRAVIFNSRLPSVAAELMDSRTVRLHHDHMLTKQPATRQKTPWHQDQPYYNIKGRQNVSMWIPVDPVTRESTLELVAGSHLGPWLMPRSFMANEAKWFPEGSLADLPNVDADRSAYHRIAVSISRPASWLSNALSTTLVTPFAMSPRWLRRKQIALRACSTRCVRPPAVKSREAMRSACVMNITG